MSRTNTPVSIGQYQARELLERSDNRGHEQSEKPFRPWLVLSDGDMHDKELFIGCPCTKAEDRREPVCLYRTPTFIPPMKQPTNLDLQHLWTFRFDRDRSRSVHTLEPRHVVPVLRRLDERLRPTLGFSEAPRALVGRIAWVELAATPSVSRSDLAALRQALNDVGANWEYQNTRIAAMVVASDLPERRRNHQPLRLITVVPLLDVPALLADPDNPKIAVPPYHSPDASESQKYLAALTQVLLTVDYRSKLGRIEKREGRDVFVPQRPRVFFENGPLKSWLAKPSERDAILRDVRAWLGIGKGHEMRSTDE